MGPATHGCQAAPPLWPPCHPDGDEGYRHLWNLHEGTGNGEQVPKPLILALPVDSAWTFVRFDIHFIVIHIDLGNVHLKVVGQELDGLPYGSYPGATWRLEYLLQGGQVRACSCGENTGQRGCKNPADRQTDGADTVGRTAAVAEFRAAQREGEGASLGTIRQAPAPAEPQGSAKSPLRQL